jgi:hypothetical protein
MTFPALKPRCTSNLILQRAPGRLRRQFLTDMAEGYDLNAIRKDLVDHPVWSVEYLANRCIAPLGDDPPLVWQITQQFDALNQPVEPL